MRNTIKKQLVYLFIRIKFIMYLKNYKKKQLLFSTNIIKGNESVDDFPFHSQKEYMLFWNIKGCFINKRIYRSYELFNNLKSIAFFHEPFYKYYIEPKLNDFRYSQYFGNKLFLEEFIGCDPQFSELFVPCSIIRKIDGIFYNNNNALVKEKNVIRLIIDNNDSNYLLKETYATGGGRGVYVLDKLSQPEKLNLLKSSDNFIIQSILTQHKNLEYFNESSLNTIRIITYRSVNDESINVLHAFLRFGSKGKVIDNQGIDAGFALINMKGKTNEKCLLRSGETIKKESLTIPGFDLILYFAKAIAKKHPFHRILGFDFAVLENGTIAIIEINSGGLNPEATNYISGPFFKNFTSEVIAYCRQKDIHGSIHY